MSEFGLEYDCEMILEETFMLLEKLLDPDYDVAENEYGIGFGIIEVVRDICNQWRDLFPRRELDPSIESLVEQMLLRIRSVSPHVYAITVGQFPEFDQLDAYWEESGYRDIDGYTWMAPKPNGRYTNWRN